MDLAGKIRLGLVRNAEHLRFAQCIFEQEGYDLGITLGTEIQSFRQRKKLGTSTIGTYRDIMHDAAHVLTNSVEKSIGSEAHAAIGEMVLLRGPYDSEGVEGRNGTDWDIVEEPTIEIPDFETAMVLVNARLNSLNEYYRKQQDPIVVARAELEETYRKCCTIDEFFQVATHGRILDQLSTKTEPNPSIVVNAQDMPLCFFGIVKRDTAKGPVYELMSPQERQRLMHLLSEGAPHQQPVWDLQSDPRYGQSCDTLPEANL